jgi:Carboxypeptidase regulatory-like domain
MKRIVLAVLSMELIALGAVRAQAPIGAIAGHALDPTGAAISGARVIVTNKETQASRDLVTAAEGDYSAPALLAGRASMISIIKVLLMKELGHQIRDLEVVKI